MSTRSTIQVVALPAATPVTAPDNSRVFAGIVAIVIVLCIMSWFVEVEPAYDTRVASFTQGSDGQFEIVDVGNWFVLGSNAITIPSTMSVVVNANHRASWDYHDVRLELGYSVKDPLTFYTKHKPNADDMRFITLKAEEPGRTRYMNERMLQGDLEQTLSNFATTVRDGCGTPASGRNHPLPSQLRDALDVYFTNNGLELLGGSCRLGS